MSSDYDAFDFVKAYAESVKKEDEYSQVDDMLRGAAVMIVKANEMLEDTLPDTEKGEK